MIADARRQSSYDAYLLRKKIDLRVLLPFVAFTCALMPMVIQVRTLQGFHGPGYQLVTHLIVVQSLLLLIITVLELVMDRLVCVSVPRDQLEWLRGVLMVVYLVSSPVGHGGILYCRSLTAPCPSNALITDLNFCTNNGDGHDAGIQMDNYMCLVGYAIFYQALFPVNWKWHVLAWAIGLVALLITGAEHFGRVTASGKAALVVMLIFDFFALACQYALQRMLVRAFFDKLACDTLHYESLNEDCNIHSLPFMQNTLALTPTTFSSPPTPGGHFDSSNDDCGAYPLPPTPVSSSLSRQLAPAAAPHGAYSGYVSLQHRPLNGPLQPSLTPSLESHHPDSSPGMAEGSAKDEHQQDGSFDDRSVDSAISSITMPEGLASLGDASASASASIRYTSDGEVVCADIKSIKPRFGAL